MRVKKQTTTLFSLSILLSSKMWPASKIIRFLGLSTLLFRLLLEPFCQPFLHPFLTPLERFLIKIFLLLSSCSYIAIDSTLLHSSIPKVSFPPILPLQSSFKRMKLLLFNLGCTKELKQLYTGLRITFIFATLRAMITQVSPLSTARDPMLL